MDKDKNKQVSLYLNLETVNELKKMGYNISQLVRNFLKKKLEAENEKSE